jgi:hypothetical protein
MKMKHRIIPGHRGGEYVEGNVINVEVVQCDKQTASHAMWHYAEWRLWGRLEDRLAWRGLAGFMRKEEIIAELMEEGRRKGKDNREKAIRQMFADGTHPLLSFDLIEKRKEVNSRCLVEYNQSSAGREKASQTATKTNLRKVKCPHCDFVNNPGNVGKHIKECHTKG